MLNADKQTQALLDLADFIEALRPEQYDQREFDDGCFGGCIAYWGCEKFGIDHHIEGVRIKLGLDQMTAQQLFAPEAGCHTMMGCWLRGPTPKEAASVLRELAVTGEIPKRWQT